MSVKGYLRRKSFTESQGAWTFLNRLTSLLGITQKGPYVAYPLTKVISATTDTIPITAEHVRLNPTNSTSFTLAPAAAGAILADGVDGQVIALSCANGETGSVVLTDQDTLAGSNLQLQAATRTLTARCLLILQFDGSDWVEVGFSSPSGGSSGNLTVGGTLNVAGAATFGAAVIRTVFIRLIKPTGYVGATSGWTNGDASDVGGYLYLPASKTASTVCVHIDIPLGDTITGYKIVGTATSGGNAVTLDAVLHSMTAGTTVADAAIGSSSIVQVAVTANTAVASAVSSLSQTPSATKSYYLLLTGTTGASCSIKITAIQIVVTTG